MPHRTEAQLRAEIERLHAERMRCCRSRHRRELIRALVRGLSARWAHR